MWLYRSVSRTNLRCRDRGSPERGKDPLAHPGIFMKQARGKRAALAAMLLGLAVLAAAGYSCRSIFLEQWYIWQLDSRDEHELSVAARKLGELRSERAIPKLLRLYLKALREKRSEREFLDAADGAIHTMRPRTLPALVEAWKREPQGSGAHLELTGMIHRSLVAYSPKHADLVPAITELLADAHLCRDAAACLGFMGPAARTAVSSLIRLLEDPRPDEWWGPERRSAAEALGKIGPAAASAVPSLERTLRNADDAVRRAAAEAFGQLGPPAASAIPTLEEALRDHDEAVRKAAAEALDKIRRG